MNRVTLHRTLRQFRHQFLADFYLVTEQDLQRIMSGPREMLLIVFAERYGYSRDETICAWNQFVMRRVDGRSIPCLDFSAATHIVA